MLQQSVFTGSKREKRFCPAITNSESGSDAVGTGGKDYSLAAEFASRCNFQPSSWALQRVRRKNCGDDILMRNRERWKEIQIRFENFLDHSVSIMVFQRLGGIC